MNRLRELLIAAGVLLFYSQSSFSQALPVYTAPANKVGGALASGITQTLIRRGFAANDPRILQTINAVGARVIPLATAAGAGASWIGTIARLSPWVTAGVLVYQGVTWYMDNTGKVYLAPVGSTSAAPVFSNGIVQGQLCWGINADCFGSPQEALSYLFSLTVAQYPHASYGLPTLTHDSSTKYTAQYSYSIPELYLTNFSGTKVITSHNSNATCVAGSGYSGAGSTPNGCVGAALATSPYAGAPLQSYTPQQAYDNLPAAAKSAPLGNELASETANRIWKDASAQPDYPGVPFSSPSPVVAQDFAPYQTTHPEAWPPTSDLNLPVPVTGPSPVALPESNPDQTTSPSTAAKIDFGADPGVHSPTLESPDWLQPLLNMLPGWRTASFTATGSCYQPTFDLRPVIPKVVTMTSHCDLLEAQRSALSAVMSVVWVMVAAFIILRA